ncbi:uncharacterized protein EV420DRAFT_1560133 [Desarmillaria tabescens]|uniref:Zn(2)-C6 fungal-type domain-containing protein n=1 Tax=Armillaria tabescens TaxID=1929756 RepID=A0AA39JYI8_ARMTA|nr:uncharacterized protein EV420DRAFT_1560133 [Desarmillaria tabescens]KAK0451297.1 hypothetical protein EV420DRAFT_1560133 [Desarmillaria tabescens]
MPPIRPHRKTRNGCKTCKQRKVKCDEEFPICKNCTRRCIECVWIDTPPYHSLVPATSPRTPSSSPETSPSTITGTTGSFDLLTLELIHRYSTTTSHTLASDPVTSNVWTTIVPKLVFDPRNQCLLYAVLAVSALHVYHTDPTADRYAVAASTYHWQAKMGLHKAETDGETDIGAIFITLSLLAMYEFATSSIVSLSMSGWHITVRNITCEVAKIWPQLREGVLRPALLVKAPTTISTPLEESFSSSLSTLLSTAHSSPDLEELHDVSVYAAYKESIRILEISCKASSENWNAVAFWWTMAPKRFFRLLAEGKPRALIILAHFCVMMKRVAKDGPWWARKQWGIEAARILSALDTQWMPWLGWLLSQLDEDHAFDYADTDFMHWLSEVASLLNAS